MQLILIITIILILSFSVTNGMNDGCTVMATAVASLSIPRRYALIIVTISEFSGPFVFGIPVAITMASGIINVNIIPHTIGSLTLILSGIMGAIIVNLLAWLFRLPTSATFSLVGGMIGPAIFRYGKDAVPWAIFLTKVLGAMFLSPLLGILFGYTIYSLLKYLLRNSPFKANRYLRKTQIITLAALGLSHGTNDSQKAMGLISLALLFAGKIPELTIPLWVMTISAAALAIGITMGGTKMIKTVGYGIFNIKPVHSFAAQVSAFAILFTCNLSGVPVSTSQIISSSVIGVGSAHRGKGIRWTLIYNIFLSWIVTIPLAGLTSTLVYVVITQVFLK